MRPSPSNNGPGALRVGCSGWSYAHWRERFYPPGLPPRRWLVHYATQFDTVEVNASFYRLPTRRAVQGWVDQTPEGFVFALKASRYLTHVRRLRDPEGGIALLMDRIAPLVEARRLGPIVWQLPESFHRDDERLAGLLAVLPPVPAAVEFRHPSWFVPEVLDLLRAHGVALVVGDHPRRPFQPRVLTTDWTLVRLHHGWRGRGGNYSRRELEDWAAWLDDVRAQGADAYVYLNNDWEGYAPRNARLLRRLGAARFPHASS